MSDRSTIFAAIRAAKGGRDTAPAKISRDAARLVADANRVQPKFDGLSPLERFIFKATSERVTATVAQVPSTAQVPVAVAEYLRAHDQSLRVCVQPVESLNQLNWSGFELGDDLKQDGGIAVTWAEYGIAETGSVVFRSGPDAPMLPNFLPLCHIVVVVAGKIRAYPEDIWPDLGAAGTPQPRLLTVVTGTSGTADIEARNVRGAHGPRSMHIIIAGG